ncbi:FAD-binding FR-type domain-containing protein [Mycena chlorophos]|uniref:NADPH--hemoprotein reductase n=1 Tax=Mycena chlorophos TaxID=658473 RepID=A0A8H6TK16_MYCCL|nr:FAD-binding FR-type domain-containing protein [Mycena chlorophos]
MGPMFYLHGKSAEQDGIRVDVASDATLDQLRQAVAAKFSIALPSTVSFHKAVPVETVTTDMPSLETVDAVLGEKDVALLVSGKKVRPVPGPTGGLPIIGGYSEIYPDFMGNYQRLLTRYGHIVHVSYLGKDVYLTDDPDCAGIVLSEGEYYSKMIGDNHPLFPLKSSIPNGLFTADSTNPAWSTSHKFMMTAMGARAMRNYVKIMDHTANKLVGCFNEICEKEQTVDGFSWGLRVAGQTIGEVAVGIDFGMVNNSESSIARIFHVIGENLTLAQILFRKGRVYRALPNPEARAQKRSAAEFNEFVRNESERTLRERTQTPDMPYAKAAVETGSLLEYMLHATDEEGKKMDVSLVHENVLTFLGAGQVTTSSALGWLWFCLATFPYYARKLYASLIAAGLSKDKEITADEIAKLEYLDWFIKEMQRLYNPAFQPTRQAQKDVIMPGGFLVPKGAQVTVALHSVMVNPEHWTDPLTFNPDRWGTPAVQKRHKHAFIPFAAGARGCIGFNFALQEIKLVMARVVLNFTVENVTEGAVIYDPDFNLYRPLNFRMRLHRQVPPSEVDLRVLDKDAEAEAGVPEAAKEAAPKPAVGVRTLPRLWAVHASNNGTCLGMAGDVAARARRLGFTEVQVVSLQDSPLADADKTKSVVAQESNLFLVFVATYNGEPPDSALGFSDLLDRAMKNGEQDRFSGINFAVFGAGNTQWGPTYQAFPKKVDANIAALGGNRVFEKGSGDANGDQDAHFTEWITRLWAATAANFGVDIHGNSLSGESLLTVPPEHNAEEVKLAFVPLGSGSAAPMLAQPPVPGFVQVRVKENLELVEEGTPLPRGMRLMTFDVPDAFAYREGDHMEVFPENDPAVVERLLVLLDFVADAAFEVKEIGEGVNPKSLAALLVGRGPISLRELLVYYADLAGPLQRSSLQVIASLIPAGEPKYKAVLDELTTAGVADSTAFAQKNRNFATLLTNHPVLAQTLTLQRLLVVLRATQPRRYSIASSPLVDPRRVRLCVGVEDPRVVQHDHAGLCSSFLKRVPVGHVVWARARKAQETFHLPDDPKVPVTMVAAGTGISAFLGFLEHRRAQGLKATDTPFRLYYGTSYHDMPQLRSLISSYVEDDTVLVEAVYSEEDAPRRFAQQLLTRDALKVWVDLSNGGHVYVCGSAVRVGDGVRRSLMSVAEQVGGVGGSDGDGDEAVKVWLAQLRKEGRYSEDVFG